MMQPVKNKRGTTLVELIVCMVLLSLFTLAAVTLIQPSAQAYMDIQQQTRAQNLADTLIETLRGELMNANGYIRFADGATDPANLDSVFDAKENVSDGTAIEFSVYPNHIELIDKDLVPALKKADGTPLLTAAQAAEMNGYLHMRYYKQGEDKTAGLKNIPMHDENTAYGCTTAYAKDAYMGLYISDLHFYARGYTKNEGDTYARVNSLTVVITVSKEGSSEPLCTQRAILPLPGTPVYIEKPGTWDGNTR